VLPLSGLIKILKVDSINKIASTIQHYNACDWLILIIIIITCILANNKINVGPLSGNVP
jgi:hypothetical protein